MFDSISKDSQEFFQMKFSADDVGYEDWFDAFTWLIPTENGIGIGIGIGIGSSKEDDVYYYITPIPPIVKPLCDRSIDRSIDYQFVPSIMLIN